jgi:lipopolysaccharide export system ATP-binding protein
MQILSTVDLTKSYKGRKIVDGISLRIAQGEVVGLLGPNGAGKTTTFYIIVGLVSAEAGQILLDGVDISSFPMYLRARNGISYLPQEPSIFRKLTVEENVMAVLETLPLSAHQRRERLEEVVEELGLQQVRRSYGYMLSGGERRRVEIARSLVISPSFVLLDEPFSGIDPLTVLDIQQIILQLRGAGIGVLLTDHNVRETLQVTDRAYIINQGQIFRAGTPAELGNDAEVKRIYLGDNFRLAI